MIRRLCMIVSMIGVLGSIGAVIWAEGPVWRYSADSAIVSLFPLSNDAAVPGKNSLLAIAASGVAYRFSLDNRMAGKPLWQMGMKEQVTGVASIGFGKSKKIILCDASGSVSMASAATGEVRWVKLMPSTPLCALGVMDGNKKDETVFIGCQNGMLYSLAASPNGFVKGARLFRDSMQGYLAGAGSDDGQGSLGVHALITITDLQNDRPCALVAAVGKREVRCLSPAGFHFSSAQPWVFSPTCDIRALRSIPDIDQDGISDCAVSCGRDSLYMLSGKTGLVIMHFQTDDSLTCFTAVSFDAGETMAVAVGDRQGKVYGIIKNKGESSFGVAWLFDLRDGNAISALADFTARQGEAASGFIVGAQNNKVYVLSTKGKKIWSGKTGGTVLSLLSIPGEAADEHPCIAAGDDGGMVTLFHPTIQQTDRITPGW